VSHTLPRELLRDFIQSSLFRHRIYKGGLENTRDINKLLAQKGGSQSDSRWQQFEKEPLKNSI